MVNRLGSWAPWCLLAQSCYPLCWAYNSEVNYGCCNFLSYLFLYDPDCICSISSQYRGIREGLSSLKVSNRNVSVSYFVLANAFLVMGNIDILYLTNMVDSEHHLTEYGFRFLKNNMPFWKLMRKWSSEFT